MGVDWTAITIYGTTDYNVLDKLPPYMKELVKADKHYQLPDTYKGLKIFWSDGGFHGFGASVNLNRKHDATKKRVQRIFKELGLGKPKYCEYTSLSV